ncbi:MAG: hypothetical protein HFI85_04485 [Clostridia bacterium]|nr:hypothetical protein [Clostridia bacterium]
MYFNLNFTWNTSNGISNHQFYYKHPFEITPARLANKAVSYPFNLSSQSPLSYKEEISKTVLANNMLHLHYIYQ